MKTNTHFWPYLIYFVTEWEMFREKLQRKSKHILYSMTSRKSRRLWDNVEKYCIAGQATVDNMMHALCMLDT